MHRILKFRKIYETAILNSIFFSFQNFYTYRSATNVNCCENKMAEFPNSVFTQSVARTHRDKQKSGNKKIHKQHHTSSQSWNVSSSSVSPGMSWPSSCTSDVRGEQNIRTKLKKIKKEGTAVKCALPSVKK